MVLREPQVFQESHWIIIRDIKKFVTELLKKLRREKMIDTSWRLKIKQEQCGKFLFVEDTHTHTHTHQTHPRTHARARTYTHWFFWRKQWCFPTKNFIYYERIRDIVSKKLSNYEYWKNSINILSLRSIYRLPSKPPVVFKDNEIVFEPEVRFLGIYITENLK